MCKATIPVECCIPKILHQDLGTWSCQTREDMVDPTFFPSHKHVPEKISLTLKKFLFTKNKCLHNFPFHIQEMIWVLDQTFIGKLIYSIIKYFVSWSIVEREFKKIFQNDSEVFVNWRTEQIDYFIKFQRYVDKLLT